MEALVLCEIAAGRDDLREALLTRIGRLGFRERAKLSFVARDRNVPGNTLVAVGFPDRAGAERFVAEAIGDWLAPADVRLLAVEPTWQTEPLPLMFP